MNSETRSDLPGPGFNGVFHEPGLGWQVLGNGYRVYSPVLMRFHSPDSLSPFGAGGLNAYGYCRADPVNAHDPDGHVLKWRVSQGKYSFKGGQKNRFADARVLKLESDSYDPVITRFTKQDAGNLELLRGMAEKKLAEASIASVRIGSELYGSTMDFTGDQLVQHTRLRGKIASRFGKIKTYTQALESLSQPGALITESARALLQRKVMNVRQYDVWQGQNREVTSIRGHQKVD